MSIPTVGRGSLNVSHAVALAMYEYSRPGRGGAGNLDRARSGALSQKKLASLEGDSSAFHTVLWGVCVRGVVIRGCASDYRDQRRVGRPSPFDVQTAGSSISSTTLSCRSSSKAVRRCWRRSGGALATLARRRRCAPLASRASVTGTRDFSFALMMLETLPRPRQGRIRTPL